MTDRTFGEINSGIEKMTEEVKHLGGKTTVAQIDAPIMEEFKRRSQELGNAILGEYGSIDIYGNMPPGEQAPLAISRAYNQLSDFYSDKVHPSAVGIWAGETLTGGEER